MQKITLNAKQDCMVQALRAAEIHRVNGYKSAAITVEGVVFHVYYTKTGLVVRQQEVTA